MKKIEEVVTQIKPYKRELNALVNDGSFYFSNTLLALAIF
jgi:hypothetical protein